MSINLEAYEELLQIQRSAGIPLFGEKSVVHWTRLHDDRGLGLESILEDGLLNEGTSFTTSLDLPYPVDNDTPVGLVFGKQDVLELGYHNLPLDSVGVTALEIVYELTGGEEVPLPSYLRGVVSYIPRTLETAARTIRNYRDWKYEKIFAPGVIRSKLVPRPRYDTFDMPRQWAHTEAAKTWRVIDLPEADG